MTIQIINGDCRDVLKTLPSSSVHCVVTSPPYWGLRNYGHAKQIGLEQTTEEYVSIMVSVFREVKRILRDDGTLWLNLGDCYSSNIIESGVSCLPSKNLVGIPWRVAFALQADGWILRSDIIWCLSACTRVYARTSGAEGPSTIHDLVRLDPSSIQLWNGERWTQVLGWSSRKSETLRITLRSGERIIASPNHQWPLSDGRIVATNKIIAGDVLATTKLPEPMYPTGNGIPLDLAWLAGLYLAEGSRSGDAIQISGHAKEIERHERVIDIAERYGGSAVIHSGPGYAVSVVLHGTLLDGAIRHFVAGKTALNKHIHSRAWRSSNQLLRAFVEGYLDGDGCYDADNDRWRLGFGNNPQWCDSLRTLAARLGATLTISPTLAKMGKTRVFDAYRGEWRWNTTDYRTTKQRSEVIAIDNLSEREVWDIGVADEPHLFSLASGILTHNSKPNPMPESVTDRPTKAHEYIFMFAKSEKYFWDQDAVREDFADDRMGNPGKSKRVTAKQKGYINFRKDGGQINSKCEWTRGTELCGRNIRDVWTISTQPFAESHFAVFPQHIPELCIKAGTSEKGCCGECEAPLVRILKKFPTITDGSKRK